MLTCEVAYNARELPGSHFKCSGTLLIYQQCTFLYQKQDRSS